MKNLDEISIFGEYSQKENKLTSAILQILKVGGEPLIRKFCEGSGILLPSNEISIFSQPSAATTRPDGLLRSNFAFDIYIESKINNQINKKQLDQHLKFSDNLNNGYLIYITTHLEKPSNLNNKVYWINWYTVLTVFEEYIISNESELLNFLILHFKTLLTNTLHISGWTSIPNDESVMVLAGSFAESFALKENLYICQNKRTFKPSKYIAFYNSGLINHIFEILDIPKNDVDITKLPQYHNFDNVAKAQYADENLKQVFNLKLIEKLATPIINDTLTKTGKNWAYTVGTPRYTTLNKIRTSNLTSQL